MILADRTFLSISLLQANMGRPDKNQKKTRWPLEQGKSHSTHSHSDADDLFSSGPRIDEELSKDDSKFDLEST